MKIWLIILLVACGASARERTMSTTFTTANVATAAFFAYESHHETDIVTKGPDRATVDKNLAEWKTKRVEVQKAIAAVYNAIDLAQKANDDASLAAMVAQALTLTKSLQDLGVLPK